jgi:uncharacterized protein YndB with AHSA1/START domain
VMETGQGIVIERTFKATPEEVWTMWTTKEGLEKWWGPEGFVSEVKRLDLRVGGDFDILMRATGPEQVAFLTSANLPLENSARGTYTDIVPALRLAFETVADFVPGVEPFVVHSSMELTPAHGGTAMRFYSGAMHDPEWTQRAQMGWSQQLDKLVTVLS